LIYLEDVPREVGNVDPTTGLSRDRFVAWVLGASEQLGDHAPHRRLHGSPHPGALEAVNNYVKGALQFFRNATAHRPTP
jgi:hypothetical protein